MPYYCALKKIRMLLTLVKLGDLSGKGSHLGGLITLSSTLLLALSSKNPLDFTLMFREDFVAEANLAMIHSVPSFLPSAVYQRKGE